MPKRALIRRLLPGAIGNFTYIANVWLSTAKGSDHLHVRFGSLADICSAKGHVRFTLKSGHSQCTTGCRVTWLCVRLCVAFSEGGFSGVGHLNPLRIRRGLGAVVVVPVPPLVWRRLRVALWRIFPFLLAPERGHVEVAPSAPHRLIAAAIDKVGAEHLVAVADECIVAVPLVHAEVGVEAICDGVPRHLPTHSRLQALDVLLWRARCVRERGVAGVQMSKVGDLIGPQ
jgi:hypothetical protein